MVCRVGEWGPLIERVKLGHECCCLCGLEVRGTVDGRANLGGHTPSTLSARRDRWGWILGTVWFGGRFA